LSQIVYTELEGQPLRWEYKGAIPKEKLQETDTTPKSWSVSTTSATQIQNANTGTDNDVYSSNMVAQIFRSTSNALKVTAIQVYGRKSGSPPNALRVEIRDVKLVAGTYLIYEGGSAAPNSLLIFGNNWFGQTFAGSDFPYITQIDVYVARTGSPPNLIVELREWLGTAPSSTIIQSWSIPTTATNNAWYSITISPSIQLDITKNYCIIFHTEGNGGNASNYYNLGSASNFYSPGTVVSSINGGSSWIVSSAYDLTRLRIYAYTDFPFPGENVLASGQIAPASVGTTNAWINISLSSPIILRMDEFFSVVAYTIGGDATNKYILQSGANSLTRAYEVFMSTTNSGGTWSTLPDRDLSFKVDGVQYAQIYSGSRPNNVYSPLGRVALKLSVLAQTSSSMEFAGFDDHTLAVAPTTSTSTSLTEVVALPASAPRIRKTPQSSSVSFSIWAAGAGLTTKLYTQRHTIMDKNPIYPRDFGFSELYLVADEIGPQGLVVLNDKEEASLFNSSDTQTRFDAYELFRIPVRKAEVIQEPSGGGKIILYFIGIL